MRCLLKSFAMTLALALVCSNTQAQFYQDFDSNDSNPYEFTNSGGSEPDVLSDDDPRGNYARLTNLDGSNNNSIAFDELDSQTGPAENIQIAFDFRMSDDDANNDAGGCCTSAADGLGLGLYSVEEYFPDGAANPADGGAIWERPTHAEAFTIGLDVFQNIDVVNINWDGLQAIEADVAFDLEFDLNDNTWHRAVVDLTSDGGDTILNMDLIRDVDGDAEVQNVFLDEPVDGMDLSDLFGYRVIAGGRTGGAFVEGDIDNIYVGPIGGDGGVGTALQAGDANQDLEFNQLDLVQVQIAAKYLTGAAATWGDGDWNGAPGGEVGNPPQGNGAFDQVDIIAALTGGWYLQGPYGAINLGGQPEDNQTSITYDPGTGEVGVNAPAGVELTSVNIDSTAGIFSGDPAQNLGGSFDNDGDNNIFKATFGSSFGSLSFGNVAQAGLSEDFVANDLTVVGSLNGGGDLGAVDLIYVPEPSTVLLSVFGFMALLVSSKRRSR